MEREQGGDRDGGGVADGFFNAAGLVGFVSTKGRSISKMSGF